MGLAAGLALGGGCGYALSALDKEICVYCLPPSRGPAVHVDRGGGPSAAIHALVKSASLSVSQSISSRPVSMSSASGVSGGAGRLAGTEGVTWRCTPWGTGSTATRCISGWEATDAERM